MKLSLPELNLYAFKSFAVNFIIPLLALIVTVFLVVLVLIPGFKNYPLLVQTYQQKSQFQKELVVKTEKLNKLYEFRDTVLTNRALINKAMADAPMVPQLLAQLNMIAKDSGVVIQKLTYSISESTPKPKSAPAPVTSPAPKGNAKVTLPAAPKLEPPAYDVVLVNVGLTANYQQLLVFLKAIENASRLISVDNLRFSQDTEQEGSYNISLVLSSPYVQVKTDAVTDDPIAFELNDPKFRELVDRLAKLKFYQITVEDIQKLESAAEKPKAPDAAAVSEPAQETPTP